MYGEYLAWRFAFVCAQCVCAQVYFSLTMVLSLVFLRYSIRKTNFVAAQCDNNIRCVLCGFFMSRKFDPLNFQVEFIHSKLLIMHLLLPRNPMDLLNSAKLLMRLSA